MTPEIQLATSAAWLGQMGSPSQLPSVASPASVVVVIFLALLACGFLAILLAAIFGRWKLLAAFLLCGVAGMFGLGLLGLIVVPVSVRQSEVVSYDEGQTSVARPNTVTYEYRPNPVATPPIELPTPASPTPESSQATIVQAVGSALYDAFVKPAVDNVQDASKSNIIPPGRPAWVEQEPHSRDGIDYVSLSTGPYTSSTECYKSLKALTQEAVAEQTAALLGSEAKGERVPLDDQFIADHIQLQTYKESLDTTVGPMQQWHAYLQFNQQFRDEVERRWRQVQQATRLTYAGALFAGVLAVLSILYGSLSYDTVTAGRYRARLQTIAGAAILGVVGGGILLTQWFPPI